MFLESSSLRVLSESLYFFLFFFLWETETFRCNELDLEKWRGEMSRGRYSQCSGPPSRLTDFSFVVEPLPEPANVSRFLRQGPSIPPHSMPRAIPNVLGGKFRPRQNEDTLWRQHCVLRCCPSVRKAVKIVARCAATRNVSEDFQMITSAMLPPQF